MTTNKATGPLRGLQIVDFSTVVAGPFAAGSAGRLRRRRDQGRDAGRRRRAARAGAAQGRHAAVVEGHQPQQEGRHARPAKPEGRDLFARLIAGPTCWSRTSGPGTLDGWGITRAWLQDINPQLTILRVTGFGQDGPYRGRPGFARIFEAMSGFTHICGEEGGPPLHLGYPISDAVARPVRRGRHPRRAARSEAQHPGQRARRSTARRPRRCCARWSSCHRIRPARRRAHPLGQPQPVRRARQCLPDRRRHWASIAASTQSIFDRLARRSTCGRAPDDRLRHQSGARAEPRGARPDRRRSDRQAHPGRVARHARPSTRSVSRRSTTSPTSSPIRISGPRAIVEVPDSELGTVRMQGVVPRFSETPGTVRRAGPTIGEHNDESTAALV